MLSIKKWFHHGAWQGIELKSHCPELNCQYDFIQKINLLIKGWCGDQPKVVFWIWSHFLKDVMFLAYLGCSLAIIQLLYSQETRLSWQLDYRLRKFMSATTKGFCFIAKLTRSSKNRLLLKACLNISLHQT